MMRRTIPLFSGPYSRMMDLGGVPMSKVKGDAFQGSLLRNLKVRGVLLDFHLVSIDKDQAAAAAAAAAAASSSSSSSSSKASPSSPPTSSASSAFMQALNPLKTAAPPPSSAPSSVSSAVTDLAALLGVKLGSTATFGSPLSANKDDLSLLGVERPSNKSAAWSLELGEALQERGVATGGGETADTTTLVKREGGSIPLAAADAAGKSAFKQSQSSLLKDDVRLKYGAALQKKGIGVSGLVDAVVGPAAGAKGSKVGDSSFHLGARAMAMRQDEQDASEGDSAGRWMVANGMGTLMNFIGDRSMKVGLVSSDKRHMGKSTVVEMDKYVYQLGHHSFHFVGRELPPEKGKGGDDKNAETIKAAIDSMKGEGNHAIELGPQHVMVVSDRDDLLKAARNVGESCCCVVV